MVRDEMLENPILEDSVESGAEQAKTQEAPLTAEPSEGEVARSERYRVLPGVPHALDLIDARPGAVMGLATGNLERGAEVKLRRGDLWRLGRHRLLCGVRHLLGSLFGRTRYPGRRLCWQ